MSQAFRKMPLDFLNKEPFRSMSSDATVIYLSIAFHPQMLRFGCMRHTLEGLAAEISHKQDLKRFREGFRELLGERFTVFDESCFFLALPHFLELWPPDNPNMVKGWSKLMGLVPMCEVQAIHFEEVARIVSSRGDAFRDALPELFRNGSRNGSGNGSRNNQRFRERSKDLSLATADTKTAERLQEPLQERFQEPSQKPFQEPFQEPLPTSKPKKLTDHQRCMQLVTEAFEAAGVSAALTKRHGAFAKLAKRYAERHPGGAAEAFGNDLAALATGLQKTGDPVPYALKALRNRLDAGTTGKGRPPKGRARRAPDPGAHAGTLAQADAIDAALLSAVEDPS